MKAVRATREINAESCAVFRTCLKAVRYQNCREDYSFLIALLSKFISSPVSLGIVISIGVGTTVVCVVIGFLVAKCYLNWRRQYRKRKKISASLNGTVQKLVISSQPVDFVPLLIQDQLEAEDGEIDNTQYVSLRGRSAESLLESRKDSKVRFQVALLCQLRKRCRHYATRNQEVRESRTSGSSAQSQKFETISSCQRLPK